MRKKIVGLAAFAATVAVLLGALKMIHRVPQVAQQDLMRRYRTVEEVKAALQIPRVYAPSYFPQNLGWPPSTILAQGRPFPAVVMEFEKTAGKDTVLVISQAASAEFRAAERIRMTEVVERIRYPLKGRDAVLDVGKCARDEPCAGISWAEGELRIVVLSKSTPFELIRIAESMIP